MALQANGSIPLKSLFVLVYLKLVLFAQITKFQVDAVLFRTSPAVAEAYVDTETLILRYGYPVETHTVLTKDGYNLNLFRIPHGKSIGKPNGQNHYANNLHWNTNNNTGSISKPKSNSKMVKKGSVFIQHGYIHSSTSWLLLRRLSLPYMLADEGYDVWLGNFRGTEYSSHLKILRKDTKFWDFSYDEMGKYDLPAMINYVLSRTKKADLMYVGHSMGTTAYFIAMDLYPELQQSVKAAVLLAPAAYLCHLKSPLRFLGHFSTNQLENLGKSTTDSRTFPMWLRYFLNEYGPRLCTGRWAIICGYFYGFIGGPNPVQITSELLQKAIGYIPADSSAKSGIQYLQGLHRCQFRRYDYGAEQNRKLYKSAEPPSYNLTKINVPTFAMYGGGDWLIPPKDALRTISELQNVQKITKVEDPLWVHFDFMFGQNAPRLVYQPSIEFLSAIHLQSNISS